MKANLLVRGENGTFTILLAVKTPQIGQTVPISAGFLNTINSIIFKFLWHPSFLEAVKRTKLQENMKSGGIDLTDIKLKMQVARFIRIQNLMQNDQAADFWEAWASYNLGSKMTQFNKNRYTLRLPNKFDPNETWTDV